MIRIGRRGRQGIAVALPLYIVLAACAADPDNIDRQLIPKSEGLNGAEKAAEQDAYEASATFAPLPPQGSAVSLDGAVHRAIAWHPSIKQATSLLDQSTAEIAAARAAYMPQIRGGVRSAYTDDDDTITPQLNLTASQVVYDFGKVASAVSYREAGAEASRAQLLAAVDDVIRDTAHSFVEAQRYKALLKVTEDQVKGVDAIAELVRQRKRNGASTRSDEVQAEARLQAAQSKVLEISSQVSRWQTRLATLIGESGPISLDTAVPKWLPAACDTYEPDWSKLPAAIRAEAERKGAEAQLRLSRAQIFPTVSVEADATYDLNGSDRGRRDLEAKPDLSVGLNLSGNIYDGGAMQARRSAATFALAAAEAAHESARVETLQALADARSQTTNMNQLLASLSSRIGMMEETRDLYRRQYLDLGTRSLLDLLNAEQELQQAHFDVVNTTHDLRRLNIDCLLNSGMSRKALSLEGMMVRGVRL